MRVRSYQMDWPHTSMGSVRWESEVAQGGVATQPPAQTLPHTGLHTCSCCMSLSRSAWLVQQSGASLSSCTPWLHSTQALSQTSGGAIWEFLSSLRGSQ